MNTQKLTIEDAETKITKELYNDFMNSIDDAAFFRKLNKFSRRTAQNLYNYVEICKGQVDLAADIKRNSKFKLI